MSIAVVYVHLICTEYINKCREMRIKVEVILIISKIECDIYSLFAESFLEKNLLICNL